MIKFYKHLSKITLLQVMMSLIFCLALSFAVTADVHADGVPSPPLTAIFHGSVTNNGAAVGAGYTVAAKVNGAIVASTTTDSSGGYGNSPNPQFQVPCSTCGQTVQFTVNGVNAQTATCACSTGTTLNLSVTGAPASYTPPASSSCSITTTSLPGGTVGTAYSATLSASGGSGSYSWSIISGTPPAGLTLSGATITGTPTTAATGSFTVQVNDTASHTATAALSITISAGASSSSVSITSTSLPAGTVGTAYSTMLSASGGTGSYTWSLASGSLPAGLTLSGAAISGTPTTAATGSFTVQVSDAASHTATAALSITISAAGSTSLSITTASLPGGTVGTAYSATLSATGGTGSYTWSIASGSLPGGLTLSGATILGTPMIALPYAFTVQVTDSASHTASVSLSIYVSAASTTTTTTIPTTPTQYTPPSTPSTSQSPSAPQQTSGGTPSSLPTGGTAPATFTLSDFSATPGSARAGGPVVISLRVTNSGDSSGSKSLTLKVNDQAVAQQDVYLTAGESKVITFDVTKNDPGSYTASVESLSTNFSVTQGSAAQPSGSTNGLPSAITSYAVLGVLAVGGILIIVLVLMIIFKRRSSGY